MDQRTDNERRQDTAPGREAKPAIGETRKTQSWLGGLRQRRRMVLVVTALLIVALVGLVVWWVNAGDYETTDDAFIDARTVQISAQVSAAIVEVPVTDNQLVEAGAVLVRLDDRDSRRSSIRAKPTSSTSTRRSPRSRRASSRRKSRPPNRRPISPSRNSRNSVTPIW